MKQRFSTRTRLVSALLTLAMVFTFLPISAFAATGDLYINDANFADKNFQNYLKDNITDGRNYLTQKQWESVKEISFNTHYPVEQLNGIQYFPNLEKLEAGNLRSVDLSYNTALKELNVAGSRNLTSLDLSHNPNLQRLNCSLTGLTSLDLSHNPELEYLRCVYNKLTKLDLSNNTKLTEVYCFDGKLTELNVKQCNLLTKLDCSQNNLTELETPGTSWFRELNCSDNPLNTLNLGGKFLAKLKINRTNLTALKLNYYTWMESIQIVDNNQLTRLEVSRMPKLKELQCQKNQLTQLELSELPALQELYCNGNQLTQLALSDLPELRKLYCNGNQMTQLDVKELSTLKQLYCNNNQLTSLDVSGNPALWYLECSENQLTSLDVSKNPALMNLYCKKNQLTSLDVSQNTNLAYLSCSDNKIDINIEETSRTFDLSTLPGFDVTKASGWKGGTVNGSILTVDNGATEVTYSYDCGPGATREFSLQVLTKVKQVNIRVTTPKKGEMPDETVVILDNGADVCDVKIRWGMGDIGGEPIPGSFQTGKRYTLQVGLYAKPGYKFSEDTVCTVNGQEAKFFMTMKDDTEYYATRSFVLSLNPGGFEHDHKMEMTHDEHSHWMECPICHTVQDTEAHVYDDDKDTTCNVCGYVRSLTPETPDPGTTPGGSTGGDGTGTTTPPSGGGTGTTTPPSGGEGTGTTTPPSGGEGTGTTTPPSGGGTGTTTPPSGGDGTGTTTPPSGGGTGTTTPPSGGDGTGTTTPPSGGGTGTTTPPSGGGTGTTTPPSGGGTGTTTPPSGGDGTGTTTPPSGGGTGTTTPPSGGGTGTTTPPSGGGGGGAGLAVLAVGGTALVGLAGYGIYSYVSEQQLKAILPEGTAVPENRAQTALLLWNTAGRPEPAAAPAFADVADPDTAKAAQWCVEQNLLQTRRDGAFAPDSTLPAYKTLNAYRQLTGK